MLYYMYSKSKKNRKKSKNKRYSKHKGGRNINKTKQNINKQFETNTEFNINTNDELLRLTTEITRLENIMELDKSMYKSLYEALLKTKSTYNVNKLKHKQSKESLKRLIESLKELDSDY